MSGRGGDGKTPWRAAKDRGLPYVVISVDRRTADVGNGHGGRIELKGPVSLVEAEAIEKLILNMVKNEERLS